jgi:hypothetical protein
MAQATSLWRKLGDRFTKVDGRFRRRKNRTDPMSFRFSPQTRQLIQRLADAENASYVEIVEQALALLDKVKKA